MDLEEVAGNGANELVLPHKQLRLPASSLLARSVGQAAVLGVDDATRLLVDQEHVAVQP